MESKEVIHKSSQPLKIILQRTHVGAYAWEVHAQGADLSEILPVLQDTDSAMRRKYGGK